MNLKTIKEPRFSTEKCNALFAAILVHDDIELAAELPDKIHLEYSQQQFTQCYRICLQLWQEGVDRKFLIKITKNLFWHHRLDPEDALAFKHIRARFKHLRFAYMAFEKHHDYPAKFHLVIRKMGNLQDSFKHKQFADVMKNAIYLRLLLTNFVYTIYTREIKRFQPSTAKSFREYINNEIHFLRLNLAEEKITGRTFHEMRKVISRQVALYDNLITLYPSPYHDSMTRYLSTLNGLMGNMHDELVAEQFNNHQDYESYTFKIPEEIRQRLIALTEKYEEPLCKVTTS
jgi:hypothetical protein